MSDPGFLIILSGFAGAGKGTVTRELLSRYPDRYALSVSATTRPPREGEEEGREYFFKTGEEFSRMAKGGDLLEYACYVGNYYGTPRRYVEEQIARDRNVILEIEIQGALQVKEKFPEALLLFLTPPTASVLKERLDGRGTESEEVVRSRLARAVEEADGCEAYDYLIINDDLGECVQKIHHIIESEHSRMRHGFHTIEAIKSDLKGYVKGENT